MLKTGIAALASLALAALLGCSKSEPTAPSPPPAPSPTATAPPATAPPPAPAPAPAHHDEHAVPSPAAAVPGSLHEAVAKLDAAYQELAGIVKDGDLSKAHHAADQLRAVGASLPDLATKGGLPPDDVKAITIAGKKLGILFKDMDEAGDAGKRDEAQKVFARYEEPLATIKKAAARGK